MKAMKPNTEMVEGPEALARFESTMKAIFSKRKADVLPEKRKALKARKDSAKPKR
jgi:hypothetical protein